MHEWFYNESKNKNQHIKYYWLRVLLNIIIKLESNVCDFQFPFRVFGKLQSSSILIKETKETNKKKHFAMRRNY